MFDYVRIFKSAQGVIGLMLSFLMFSKGIAEFKTDNL